MPEDSSVAAAVVHALTRAGQTVAAAESLTGGLVSSTLVDVPGASAAFRGGFVVYATELKATLAGVSAPLLAERGPVDPDVAAALAEGVRARCDADWGLATTGVAGPEPQDGMPVGLVYVAVAGPGGTEVRRLGLTGDRAAIRVSTVTEALRLLADRLGVSVLPRAVA
ncbi:nicotinamide-nucleotide amidase [Catenuloplanes nepalensis]|uniref:Nicotinamide-nucleotide amidase n=1 Tax=Catenuloplanes nepalensis TaxID=587533 RepID=A0ABT9N019_9ACTN|nr:CinA family protein [Catenuloplanes nepalensis]MDP9797045.1 nicotinamide-nucleotide amidase [Catenuloplanes nepalensis]